MNAIRRLHGGQLIIVWILLLLCAAAFGVSWLFTDASFERSVQEAVDASSRPRIVIDGLVFDDTSLTSGGIAGDASLREEYARETLLQRGMPVNAATSRAKEIARALYYDSSRTYYDGIRDRYRSSHPIKRFLAILPGLSALALPLIGLAITWIWLGGRVRAMSTSP